MVIRQESADHEYYALEWEKFEKNYEIEGTDIDSWDMSMHEFRERGFKYYLRKGHLKVYKVIEKDMKFVPEGKFQPAFSPFPQPLRLGDYLVTVYPECSEIYMSRHATIYNDDGQQFLPNGV
jgi:hypothetical protein